ncbi:MAG: D-alanine--D-alanine ligase [Clostridia bacterium]
MNRNVLVFFGGVSVEHDISIITGLQTIGAIRQEEKTIKDKKKKELIGLNFVPVYISRGGGWYTGKQIENIEFLKNFSPVARGVEKVSLIAGEPCLARFVHGKYKPFIRVDMAILCNHGRGGEDGSLQGILSSCKIPQTSCGVLGSAVCMDKILMKSILKANGFNQTPCVWFTRMDWLNSQNETLSKVETLGYPVVVKPSNLGSSIGISICESKENLIEAINIAEKFDTRILVEKAVQNLREFNCSILGNSSNILVSDVEEPISWEKFLSFEAKYLSNGKLEGMGSSKREFPAKISEELTQKIKEESEKAFKVLACKGVVRADFLFNSETEELFLNEVNTIPGSLANYFWSKEGISFQKLISLMIEYASEDFVEENKNIYLFSSKALENFGKGKNKSVKQ